MLPYTALDLINAVSQDFARNDRAASRRKTSWSHWIARLVARNDRRNTSA
jgi:hypothetical protein